MKLKFPATLNARKLAKMAVSVGGLDELLNNLEVHHLVVCWDDTKDSEEEPVKSWGFLNKVTFDGETRKYEILKCSFDGDMYPVDYDHIQFVPDDCCPSVFYKNCCRQDIGRLIGMKVTRSDVGNKYVAVIRVSPFREARKCDLCKVENVVFTDDIPLGIVVKPVEANAVVKEA